MAATVFQAVCTAPVATSGILTGDASDTYLSVTGAAGSYASTPDASTLDIAADLEIVVRVALNAWTGAASQTLVAKYSNAGGAGAYSYQFEVGPGGALRLNYSTDGATNVLAFSSSAPPLVAGTFYWLKVTLDADNGAAGRSVAFYWAPDSDVEPTYWNQAGTTSTVAGTVTLFNSTQPVTIGATSDGALRANGKFLYVCIRSAIGSLAGSTRKFTCDLVHQTAGASSFTARQGNVVTVNSPAALVADPNPWRLAVQVLVSSYGARVGMCNVGTARVSSYEWLDLTADLQGLEWSRGKSPAGLGYPRPDVGTATITLDNSSGRYSPWNQNIGTVTGPNISTSILNREWNAKALVRVVMFKANATTTTVTDASGFTYISRANWSPRFTGYVESWDEQLDNNRTTVSATVVETMSFLAGVNKSAQTSVGAGDTLIARLTRLAADAGWAFPIVEGNSPNYFNDPAFSLLATNLSANRLAEVYLSGDSILATLIWSDTDGSIRVGYSNNAAYTATSASAADVTLRLSSSTNTLASDLVNFPQMVTAYYEPPLQLSNLADWVVNYISATRVGGVEQVAQTTESQGLHGMRSMKRTDLICSNDLLAFYFADGLRSELDGYSDPTFYPATAGIDQSITPGTVTVSNQQRAQRAMGLGNLCLVDWYTTGATTPSIRILGRMVQLRDYVTKTTDGISWTTAVSVLPRFNYLKTS